MSGHVMARKPASAPSSRRRDAAVTALVLRAGQMAAAVDLRADLGDLVKRRAELELLLIDLTDADESVPRVWASARRPESKLHHAADRVGKLIGKVEQGIARAKAPTLRDAITKLEVYADCQGYSLRPGRSRRGVISIEERLFCSIVKDFCRIEKGSSNHRISLS